MPGSVDVFVDLFLPTTGIELIRAAAKTDTVASDTVTSADVVGLPDSAEGFESRNCALGVAVRDDLSSAPSPPFELANSMVLKFDRSVRAEGNLERAARRSGAR